MNGIVTTADIDIHASVDEVWRALTDPAHIEQYMFGSRVETDWQVGGPIVWKGEWDGRAYEDKGEVLAVEEPRRLSVSHSSPLSGQEDVPESYHTLVYELTPRPPGDRTHLSLSQDGNRTEEEAERARANWQQMLGALKDHLESPSGGA